MPPNVPRDNQPGPDQDVTALKLRLKKAGVDLETYKWDLLNVFYGPTAFEFSCPDYQRLVQDAERSPHLALNFADLGGQDSWRQAGYKSVGYTEIGAFAPVHLDVAIDQAGLCRVYLMPASVKFKADTMRQAQLAMAHDSPVYSEIAKRLADCNPPVKLDDHVAKIIGIKNTRLDGVNFIARDYKKLIRALMAAEDGAGSPVYAHATIGDPEHWALKASFLATDGTGFREVFRPKLSDPTLADAYAARGMRRYAGQFTENTGVPDLSSLHCAISSGECNIHIDETGFVLADESGNPVLDPDFLQHLVNELLFKTYAKKILPDGFVDRVNLILPSSFVDYDRVGLSFDLKKTKNYRVTLTMTCSISGDHDCSGTVTVSGRL